MSNLISEKVNGYTILLNLPFTAYLPKILTQLKLFFEEFYPLYFLTMNGQLISVSAVQKKPDNQDKK